MRGLFSIPVTLRNCGDGEEQASAGYSIPTELYPGRVEALGHIFWIAGCGVEQFAINFDSVFRIFCSVKSKLG